MASLSILSLSLSLPDLLNFTVFSGQSWPYVTKTMGNETVVKGGLM